MSGFDPRFGWKPHIIALVDIERDTFIFHTVGFYETVLAELRRQRQPSVRLSGELVLQRQGHVKLVCRSQGAPWTRYCRKLWVCHRSGLHAGWGDRGTKAAPDERIGAAPTGCFDIEQA